MRQLTSRLVLCAPIVGCLLVGWSGTAAAQTVPPRTPTPAFAITTLPGSVLSPTAVAPLAPRSTAGPTLTRGNVEATQTAAIATIAAADATATARAVQPLTAVAGTATLLAQPPAAPTASQTPIASLTPLTPLATVTPIASSTPLSTAVVTPTATADPLAATRDVVLTVALVVGGETVEEGATLQVPLAVALQDGVIPPGTPVRAPNGVVFTIPAGVRVTAVEGTTTIAAPLNATLARGGPIGDQTYPDGTALVLPAGTVVQGKPDPAATVELRPGTVVQVAGRMQTLSEPLAVVIGGAPVAQPATLPRTGDAAPVLWPVGLGLLLVAAGWRLRRGT
jgi:hypothetical protein